MGEPFFFALVALLVGECELISQLAIKWRYGMPQENILATINISCSQCANFWYGNRPEPACPPPPFKMQFAHCSWILNGRISLQLSDAPRILLMHEKNIKGILFYQAPCVISSVSLPRSFFVLHSGWRTIYFLSNDYSVSFIPRVGP